MNAPIEQSLKGMPQAVPGGVRSLERRRLQAYLALLVADIAIIIGCFWLAGEFYLDPGYLTLNLLAAQLLLPVFLTIALYNGTYSTKSLEDSLTASLRVLSALVIAAALLSFIGFYAKANAQFSRVAFTLGLAFSGLVMIASRMLAVGLVHRFLGRIPINVLVIRDGGKVFELPDAFLLDAADSGIDPSQDDPTGLDLLGRYMRNMDQVIVSCTDEHRWDWARILKASGVHGEIISEKAQELGALAVRHHQEAGLSALVVSSGPLGMRSRVAKRLFDVGISAIVLTVLAPFLLLVALLIRIGDGGPALFVQHRVGRGNRQFRIYKFRTMRTEQADADGAVSASQDDLRVTRLGRWLRRSSMDELPQLFNVLRGDMSLVGPRPHALGSQAGTKLFWEVDGRYWQRHALRPGMTGLAQIRGLRGATEEESDLSDRLQADLEYVSQWSIWRDLVIMGSTLRVLFHRNAY